MRAWRYDEFRGLDRLGKDAFGDIAVAWRKPGAPVLICAFTQGGSPAASRLASVFADIGRMAGQRLG